MTLRHANAAKPRFQQRHYEMIAEVIAKLQPGQSLRLALAQMFKADSPNKFNFDKFVKACNGGGTK